MKIDQPETSLRTRRRTDPSRAPPPARRSSCRGVVAADDAAVCTARCGDAAAIARRRDRAGGRLTRCACHRVPLRAVTDATRRIRPSTSCRVIDPGDITRSKQRGADQQEVIKTNMPLGSDTLTRNAKRSGAGSRCWEASHGAAMRAKTVAARIAASCARRKNPFCLQSAKWWRQCRRAARRSSRADHYGRDVERAARARRAPSTRL